MFRIINEWPYVSRSIDDIYNLKPNPYLSLDFEWDIRTGRPTILGASDGIKTVSVPYEYGKGPLNDCLVKYPNASILGHNFLSADFPIAVAEEFPIRAEQVDDTILWHWLTNMSLCKGTKKADDKEGEKRGRGFMNLWSMCSIWTDATNWKDCIGEELCKFEQRPCPKHDVFGYNGNDCYWPLQAIDRMKNRAKLLSVDKLYPFHRDVQLVLNKMRERGVLVNVPYVDTLRKEFKDECERLEKMFPFNPDSPVQIKEFFAGRNIKLPDTKEATILDFAEEHEEDEFLQFLAEYKELGNGPDRWFAPLRFNYDNNEWEGYVDDNGFIHCNLQFFTSTGRLACSNPNLQNVAKRRKARGDAEPIGKKIRRAIIAPDGYYLYRADLKNAENRVFLHLAGHTDIDPNIDFHSYMRDMIGIKESDPFALALGGARDAAKSVTHATDYLEGIKLVPKEVLKTPKMLREIAAGARIVFPEWQVFGQVVTFTGINLAKRAFGDASYENRKRALDVQVQYFKGFPKLRELQQRITTQVDRDRCVRPPTGYVLASYGYQEDRLKTAAAMWGSNPVAHATKYALLNFESHPAIIPVLQVHDEFLLFIDCRHEPRKATKWIQECMEVEMPEIPGLKIPADPTYGKNWTDQSKIDF